MLVYIAKRLVLVVPVVFAVALVCFLLVHIAPGDPLVSVLPPDASRRSPSRCARPTASTGRCRCSSASGSGRRCNGDLGTSIATGRSVAEEVSARSATP